MLLDMTIEDIQETAQACNLVDEANLVILAVADHELVPIAPGVPFREHGAPDALYPYHFRPSNESPCAPKSKRRDTVIVDYDPTTPFEIASQNHNSRPNPKQSQYDTHPRVILPLSAGDLYVEP